MDWTKLLCGARLRRSETRSSATRSPFQQDADLVVFSAAFRRLQDKTQVQPLTESGRVRTRLTHSIEVASVGRSLGSAVARVLAGRRGLDTEQAHAIATIVHAACLAHDIGNPPFGHGGEDAVQAFFREHPSVLRGLSPQETCDLLAFDGNAQGFRTLTQLENYRFDGGLRLTYATLGAFMKYPVSAHERDPRRTQLARKKPGFFEAERRYAEELFEGTGTALGIRHPLVYLTEAADDICYAIVDLEDGYDAGLLDYHDAVEILAEIAGASPDERLGRAERIQKLRGIAIGRLVDAAAEAFLELEPTLLAGDAGPELLAATTFGPLLERAKGLAQLRIYRAPSVVERLLGGQRVLTDLLAAFVPSIDAFESSGFAREALKGRDASVLHLLGEGFVPRTRYEALLGVTDHLASLTDRAAVSLARRISGR